MFFKIIDVWVEWKYCDKIFAIIKILCINIQTLLDHNLFCAFLVQSQKYLHCKWPLVIVIRLRNVLLCWYCGNNMAHFGKRDVTYSALDNDVTPPLAGLAESTTNAAPTMITLDHEHEDANKVIIHKVPKNKGKN